MDPPGLPGPEVEDVVSEGVEHQADKEKEPDLLGQLAATDAQGLALDRFDREEQEVPAVEDRDRQEVEHAEVDAEDGDQEDVVRETLRRGVARNLGDSQRTADVIGRDLSGEHLSDAHHRQPGPAPGGLEAVHRRHQDVLAPEDGPVRLGDADLSDFDLGSVGDRKSTRLNSSHGYISYAVFCLKKKK